MSSAWFWNLDFLELIFFLRVNGLCQCILKLNYQNRIQAELKKFLDKKGSGFATIFKGIRRIPFFDDDVKKNEIK